MNKLKLYKVTMSPLCVDALNDDDATNQALSMIEEGAWELSVDEAGAACQTIEMDGLAVSLYRNTETGLLTVLIESEDLDPDGDDVHPGYAVPKIRVLVNDGPAERLTPSGEWRTER